MGSDKEVKSETVKTKDLPLNEEITDKDLQAVKGGKKKPAKKKLVK